MSSDDDIFSSQCDLPLPLPGHEQDILIIDFYDEKEYTNVERILSHELKRSVKLIASKIICSQSKNKLKYFDT